MTEPRAGPGRLRDDALRNRITRASVYELEPMAPIAVTLQERDPAVGIVTLIGEHDAFSSTRLENELAVLLDGGVRIVVDLREASFIDSQTLSVLLAARHQAEEADLGFALVLGNDAYTQVDRLLDLTGLRAAFAAFPSLEEATAAVRAGQPGPGRMRIGGEGSGTR
jgi:anti-anti-sigma factor